MRYLILAAALPALAACTGSPPSSTPSQEAPVAATYTGQAQPISLVGAGTASDLVFINIEGRTLRLAGIEPLVLDEEETDDAMLSYDAFLAQGPATCTTDPEGLASCSVGGADVAQWLSGRALVVPG